MTDFPDTFLDLYSPPSDKEEGWDWLQMFSSSQIAPIIKFNYLELEKIREGYDLASLQLEYPSRLFQVTLLDSRQIKVTIPINTITFQLLRLAISKETGLESVALDLYSVKEPLSNQTDFSNIDNKLEVLVTIKMVINCQLARPVITIYYGEKHPNHLNLQSNLPTRMIKLSALDNGLFGGKLTVIGLEDGYFKVNLTELDKWQVDNSHRNYYREPKITGWIKWIDGMR